MRTFNVIVNNKKIGEVKARSYSDAFFAVDNKFGEKTAIDCKLEQRHGSGQLDTIVKWPRGKYNGRRIVGVCVKFKLDMLRWYWKPTVSFGHMKYAHWLCFRFHFETNYE